MRYQGRLIGRDEELAKLEALVGSRTSALALVVGGARSGKSRLLWELRARASQYPCSVVPQDESEDPERPWVVIDKQLTVDKFRSALAEPPDVASSAGGSDPLTRRDPTLVLVYGYRPEPDFHEWFTREYIPDLLGGTTPRVVVVAGSAADLEELQSFPSLRIALGPLPREAILEELRSISAGIADPLEASEFDRYSEAISADPSVLDALRVLLPLGPSSAPSAGIRAER